MNSNEIKEVTPSTLENNPIKVDEVTQKPECELPAEKRTPVEVLP
jgi:hypothetical protein